MSELGFRSGVAAASDTGFRVAAGFRFVRGSALAFWVAGSASESLERTRFARAAFGVAEAEEDGPGVVVVRRDFRRGVTTASSNSPSLSPSSASGSESSDSTTLRREAAARRGGRVGFTDDIVSTELNERFVMGDGRL